MEVLEPGTILGHRYVVERLIGHGGWGSVYEAEQRYLKRQVAIKVLHSSDSRNPKTMERFVREAQAMARLRHPNIVEVIELEIEGPTPFIVMERLVGETLASHLARKGSIDRTRALDLCKQILSALKTAHDQGIVHRDLKPGNVFLVEEGSKVKVLDFGIAKVESASQLTTTGGMLGTPLYMAPEQFLLDPIDPRTDLHAVGLCLNEMLTGHRLFGNDRGPELIKRVLSDTPREARTGDPRVDKIIKKACSRSPDDRYPTTQAMIDAIVRVQRADQESENAATATLTDLPPLPQQRKKRSSWRVFVLAALVVILIGAPALVLLRKKLASSNPLPPTTSTSVSAPAPLDDADAAADPDAGADIKDAFDPLDASPISPPPQPRHLKPKASAAAATTVSSVEKDNCRCVALRKGRPTELCREAMPPARCLCRAENDSYPLCKTPFENYITCAQYVSGDNEREPCQGFARDKLPDGGSIVRSGVIRCAHCYGVIPKVRATPGTQCLGVDYDGMVHTDGTWECH